MTSLRGCVSAVQVKEDVYENIDQELLTYVEDVLLNRREDATERLLDYASTLDPKSKPCAVKRNASYVRLVLSWSGGTAVHLCVFRAGGLPVRSCLWLLHGISLGGAADG